MDPAHSDSVTRPCRGDALNFGIRKFLLTRMTQMWHDPVMKSQPRVTEELLRRTLNEQGGPQKAAAVLGVDRRTVYRWMDHYGIKRQTPEFDKAA